MGRRIYSVSFANVAVSAVQDLIALYSGANMAVELTGIDLGQVTQTTVELVRISIRRLAATVTAGTGGAAGNVRPMDRGGAAATATARTNDTGVASTSGTDHTLHASVFNLVNGYQFFPPPDERPSAGPGEALILSLDSAPGAARTMSGTLYFAELF